MLDPYALHLNDFMLATSADIEDAIDDEDLSVADIEDDEDDEDDEAEMGFDDQMGIVGRRRRYVRIATRYLRAVQKGKEKRADRRMKRLERLWGKMRPNKKAGLDSPETIEEKGEQFLSSMDSSALKPPPASHPAHARPMRHQPAHARPMRAHPAQARPMRPHPAQARPMRPHPAQARPMRRGMHSMAPQGGGGGTHRLYHQDQAAMEAELSQSMPSYMGADDEFFDDDDLLGADDEFFDDDDLLGDDFDDDLDDDLDDDELGVVAAIPIAAAVGGKRVRYARIASKYLRAMQRGKTRRSSRRMKRLERLWGKMRPNHKAGLDSPQDIRRKALRGVGELDSGRYQQIHAVDAVAPRSAPYRSGGWRPRRFG